MWDKIEHWFTFHPASTEQATKYGRIREAAKEFALVVWENTPGSADQSASIRKIREAAMTANAAVACGGK